MQDEVEVKARDWSGMDGATAWHLIDRHANNWSDVGEMMDAWLASNSAAALRQRPCCVCGAMVDTRENGTPGAELTEGKWACSEACWDRAAAESERPVVDDARMARALEAARCGLSPEHVSAIEEAIAAYDPNCGGRTVRVVDDAMVERACRAYEVAMDGEVFRPEVPEIAMRIAILAAYQQDNGGK